MNGLGGLVAHCSVHCIALYSIKKSHNHIKPNHNVIVAIMVNNHGTQKAGKRRRHIARHTIPDAITHQLQADGTIHKLIRQLSVQVKHDVC